MAEIGDVLRAAIVKNGEVRFRESRHYATAVSHHLYVHFYQRHAGAKRWIPAIGLLGERHIPQ